MAEPREFYQFYWVIDGYVAFKRKRKTFTANRESVFLYQYGDTHNIVAESVVSYWFMTMDGPSVQNLIEAFGLDKGGIAVKGCPIKSFQHLMLAIRGGSLAAEVLCSCLAFQILSDAVQFSIEAASSELRLAASVKQHLEANYTDPLLSLESLTEKFRLHRTSIYRSFCEAYRISPSEYLQRLRIDRVMSLLLDSNYSIKEIATMAGYNDPHYMARVLKGITGMTPTGFRSERQ